MYVRDIMNMEKLPDLQLVSGKKGINNFIGGIRVYEVPNAYSFMNKDDLIITTLLSVDKQYYRLIFEELNNRDISGIILFCPQLYYGKIPKDFISLSNEFNIPLLVTTEKTASIGMLYPLLQNLINTNINNLESTINIRDQYNSILLKGGYISDILFYMSNTLNSSLVLINPSYRIIDSVFMNESEKGDLLLFTEELKGNNSYLIDQITHKNIINYNGYRYNCYLIESKSNLLGIIVLVDNFKLGLNPLTVIDPGITILAILLMQKYADMKIKKNMKRHFLNLLLLNDDMSMLMSVAKFLEIKVDKGVFISIIKNIPKDLISEKEIYNNLIKNMHSFFNPLFYFIDEEIIVFISAKDSEENIKEITKGFRDSMGSLFISSPIAISDIIYKYSDLPKAYHSVEKIIIIGKKLLYNQDNNIYFSKDLYIYHQLEMLVKESTILQNWANNLLKPIINYDEQKEGKLFTTLCYLVLFEGNLENNASSLFIHKNTLIYRKELIERKLNLSIKTNKFIISLAVHIKLLSE